MSKRFLVLTEFKAVDGMSPAMVSMNKGFSRFAMRMTDNSDMIRRGFVGMDKAINRIALAGMATLGAGLLYGIKKSIEFGDAMAKVSTIADTSTMSIEQQGKAILAVSNRTGKAATELAEAQYQAISAGVNSAKSAAFVETAAKAAVGGFTDTTTAVDGLTTVLNAYGLQAEEATRISDQMLMAQNYGKTTFGEMAGYLGQVIPIASALSMSTDDLFASIAALTKQGIPTSQAMTGIKAALANVLKPAAKASELAEQLGLDFSSSALQAKGWAGFLADVTDKTGGNQEAMATLFGSVEALNTVMALTKNGGADLAAAIEAVGDSAGATEDAFAKMSQALGFRFNAVKNRGINALIAIGDAFAPVLDEILDMLEAVDLEPIIQGVRDAVPGIVEFGRVIMGVIGFLASNWKTILSIAVAIKAVSVALGVLNILTGVFGVVLAATPIGWIIAGVAAVALGIALLITHWDDVTAAVKRFIGFIVENVLPVLKNVGQTIMKYFLTPINLVIDGFLILLDLMAKIPGVGDKIGNVADTIRATKDRINTSLTGSAGTFDYAGTWKDGNAMPGAATPATTTSSSQYARVDVNLTGAPEGTTAKQTARATGVNFRMEPALQ